MFVTIHSRFIMRIIMFMISFFLLLDFMDRYNGVDTIQGISCLGCIMIISMILFIVFFAKKESVCTDIGSIDNSVFD
jgi:Na+/melibiose symporter-like transporter